MFGQADVLTTTLFTELSPSLVVSGKPLPSGTFARVGTETAMRVRFACSEGMEQMKADQKG